MLPSASMRDLETLEREFAQRPPPPRDRGEIRVICLRKGDGVHERAIEVEVTMEEGVVGDRWAKSASRQRHSQITLIGATVGELIANDRKAGFESGDNFHVTLDIS